ncbi:MAG: hypothetical protein JXR65_01090 [Bacteroidales bacterium]|nr:hypothetical protein [Bacteroidales bacterium]
MENNSTPNYEEHKPIEEIQVEQEEKIYLDNSALEHLKETRGWTLFLSILGFIFIGLMLFGGIIMSFVSSKLNTPGFGSQGILSIFLIVIVLLLYFFPIYFLFQFSQFSSKALKEKSTNLLSSALKYLKYYYRYIGILTIVGISFYFVMILVVMIMGLGANLIPK